MKQVMVVWHAGGAPVWMGWNMLGERVQFGWSDLSDAQVLALIIAAQVEEVALVACPDDVAASVCGCQTGRCGTRTHYGLLAHQRNLRPQQSVWGMALPTARAAFGARTELPSTHGRPCSDLRGLKSCCTGVNIVPTEQRCL